MLAVVLLGIGIDANDCEFAVDTPFAQRCEEPRADRQHDVGLTPQIAPERQRDAERIAAVEYTAAAPIAEHRRLQHVESAVTSAAASWAPPPQTIIGRFAAPSRLRRAGQHRCRSSPPARAAAAAGSPERIFPTHRWRIRARPVRAGRFASPAVPARWRGRLFRLADQRRMVDSA